MNWSNCQRFSQRDCVLSSMKLKPGFSITTAGYSVLKQLPEKTGQETYAMVSNTRKLNTAAGLTMLNEISFGI